MFAVERKVAETPRKEAGGGLGALPVRAAVGGVLGAGVLGEVAAGALEAGARAVAARRAARGAVEAVTGNGRAERGLRGFGRALRAREAIEAEAARERVAAAVGAAVLEQERVREGAACLRPATGQPRGAIVAREPRKAQAAGFGVALAHAVAGGLLGQAGMRRGGAVVAAEAGLAHAAVVRAIPSSAAERFFPVESRNHARRPIGIIGSLTMVAEESFLAEASTFSAFSSQ